MKNKINLILSTKVYLFFQNNGGGVEGEIDDLFIGKAWCVLGILVKIFLKKKDFRLALINTCMTIFTFHVPKGPVVTSTPGVINFSGCPGVLEFNCLKFFKSSIVKS